MTLTYPDEVLILPMGKKILWFILNSTIRTTWWIISLGLELTVWLITQWFSFPEEDRSRTYKIPKR